MFNLQEILKNEMAAQRNEQLKTSNQLVLGELIIMLESISDKALPVTFSEFPYYPGILKSWRGSYDELAIEYESSEDPPTVEELLNRLKSAIGETYQGYKGGNYRMGKLTPIWVANWGESSGPGNEITAITGLDVTGQWVMIKTEEME